MNSNARPTFEDIKTLESGGQVRVEDARGILGVSYLLAAMDGIIRPEEIVEFRNVGKLFFGESYTDKGNVLFLKDVIRDADDLVHLQKFFTTDNDRIEAFYAIAEKYLAMISTSAAIMRKTFSCWIGICCSDGEFADIERSAVEKLRSDIAERLLDRGLQAAISDKLIKEVERRILELNEVESRLLEDGEEEEDVHLRNKLKSLINDFSAFLEQGTCDAAAE